MKLIIAIIMFFYLMVTMLAALISIRAGSKKTILFIIIRNVSWIFYELFLAVIWIPQVTGHDVSVSRSVSGIVGSIVLFSIVDFFYSKRCRSGGCG